MGAAGQAIEAVGAGLGDAFTTSLITKGYSPREALAVTEQLKTLSGSGLGMAGEALGRPASAVTAGLAQTIQNIREGKAAQGLSDVRSPFRVAAEAFKRPGFVPGTKVIEAATGAAVKTPFEPGIGFGEFLKRLGQQGAGFGISVALDPLNKIKFLPKTPKGIAAEKAAESIPMPTIGEEALRTTPEFKEALQEGMEGIQARTARAKEELAKLRGVQPEGELSSKIFRKGEKNLQAVIDQQKQQIRAFQREQRRGRVFSPEDVDRMNALQTDLNLLKGRARQLAEEKAAFRRTGRLEKFVAAEPERTQRLEGALVTKLTPIVEQSQRAEMAAKAGMKGAIGAQLAENQRAALGIDTIFGELRTPQGFNRAVGNAATFLNRIVDPAFKGDIKQRAIRAVEFAGKDLPEQVSETAKSTARFFRREAKATGRARVERLFADAHTVFQKLSPEDRIYLGAVVEMAGDPASILKEVQANYQDVFKYAGAKVGVPPSKELLKTIEKKRDFIRAMNAAIGAGDLERGIIDRFRANYLAHTLTEETEAVTYEAGKWLHFTSVGPKAGQIGAANPRRFPGSLIEINKQFGKQVFDPDVMNALLDRFMPSIRKQAASDYYVKMFNEFGRPLLAKNRFRAAVKLGREVEPAVGEQAFEAFQSRLRPGEILVGVPGSMKAAARARFAESGLAPKLKEAYDANMAKATALFNAEIISGTPLAKLPPEMSADMAKLVKNGDVHLYAMPEELARGIHNFALKSTRMEDFLGVPRDWLNLWRKWTLLPWPGYHVQNAFGNGWNRYINGEGAADQAWTNQAAMAIQLPGAAQRFGVKQLRMGDEVKSLQGWFDEAVDAGILRGGVFGSTRQIPTRDDILLARFRPQDVLNPGHRNAVLRAGQKVGGMIEDQSRLAHYLYWRSKGYTPRMASDQVMRALFNAEELADIRIFGKTLLTNEQQQNLRIIFPFYTWTRNNVPFQIGKLGTTPGRVNSQLLLLSNIKAQSGVPGTNNPLFIRMDLVPYGEDEDKRLFTNFFQRTLPFSEVTKFLTPEPDLFGTSRLRTRLGGNVFRAVGGMLNPLAQESIRQFAGVEPFTGAPIERYPGEPGRFLGRENIPFTSVPWSQDFIKAARTFRAVSEFDREFFETAAQRKARGEITPRGMRLLTGIRTYSISKGEERKGFRRAKRGAQTEFQGDLRAMRNKYRKGLISKGRYKESRSELREGRRAARRQRGIP
jgi:hypothetical protein